MTSFMRTGRTNYIKVLDVHAFRAMEERHNLEVMEQSGSHPRAQPPQRKAGAVARGRASPTQMIKSALSLVDVKVVDHITVAGADPMSFAEQGLL